MAHADAPSLADYSTTTAPLFIEYAAVKHGIPYESFKDTLYCESRFDSQAVGDHGTSFGIAQIHLPAHKDISKAQALDPLWAINWAAEQFKEGHQNMWSCWKITQGHDDS